ncbi:MAG: hypothetical protein ACM3US_16540 [Sphingomonadaceae bacterium]
MGPAVFVGLVLCALVVIAFTLYGVFMGMGTLAGQVKRFWLRLNRFYPEPALAAAGGVSLAPPRQDQAKRCCWRIKGCPSTVKESCPAFLRPDLPCWLAVMQDTEDSRLKPECVACELFSIPALMTGV